MPDCTILYHYYYPDDVVSSRHFTGFAEGLAANGWNVQVLASNRYCRKEGRTGRHREIHNRVLIRRFGHPPFSQSKNSGRILNSFFLGIQWFFALLFLRTDVVVFGTDPQFCFFMIPVLKFFRPNMHFAIWGFDLYLEAVSRRGTAPLRNRMAACA